jgi:BA14K-like protein
MLKATLLPLLAAVALAPIAATAAPATVNLGPAAPTTAAAAHSPVHYRHRRGGFGRGLGVGLGIGVLGGIIAHEAYRARPGYDVDAYPDDGPYGEPSAIHGDPRSLCAQHFRSFEWSSGLYTTYAGEKRLCPYLR